MSCPYSPDIDHSNPQIQSDVVKFLNFLVDDIGFSSFRFDFAVGFAAHIQRSYVARSKNVFSVAEYWHGDSRVLQNYINATSGQMCVFDFSLYYILKRCIATDTYSEITPNLCGVIGVDSLRAVTFVENHDTAHLDSPTNENTGSSSQILSAYAFILTHPGNPCLYCEHLYDNKNSKEVEQMRETIFSLCRIRKEAGIHAGVSVDVNQAREHLYCAVIHGNKQKVALELGSEVWHPSQLNDTRSWRDHPDICNESLSPCFYFYLILPQVIFCFVF